MKQILIAFLIVGFCASTLFGLTITKEAPLTYKVLQQVVSVTDSATELPATAMPGRRYVKVQNVGSVSVYLGSLTVTADTAATGGWRLFPYATILYPYDDSVVIYGIVATGTCNVQVEEGM